MSRSARLILRLMVATVLILIAGTMAVFEFSGILEPMANAFNGPPGSLGWGTPIDDVMSYVVAGMLGTLLIVTIWLVVAPIKADVRQQFRRP